MIYLLVCLVLAIAALFATELLQVVWMRRTAAVLSTIFVGLLVIIGYAVWSPATPTVTVGVTAGITTVVCLALMLLLAQPAKPLQTPPPVAIRRRVSH